MATKKKFNPVTEYYINSDTSKTFKTSEDAHKYAFRMNITDYKVGVVIHMSR